MKKMTAIMLTAMTLLLATAMAVGAVDSVEVRGQVATGDFVWTPQNFAGFYYDIDDNIGTETLTTTITEGNKLSGDAPYGVSYVTSAQKKDFEFEDWGYYNVIGFMANKYFAGYVQDANTSPENQVLYSESTDENVLSDEQLLQILVDDDEEMTVTSGTPLKLENGYELAIRSIDIDGNKVYLELTKDGASVDSKVISPSADNANMADKTYYYKKDVGDSKDVVLIAVHFKNAFRGADQDLATIDGEWQLSDTPTEVKDDTEYDKMTITSSTPTQVVMENKDNAITLSKNKDITLMPGVSIKTADNSTLRYYIYKEITEPGTYELRGAVADADFTWNSQNFAGFYYDIDDDLGTETLTTTITEGNKLSGDAPYGIQYVTTAQQKDFEFENWGYYNVIGFMAKKYFAGYVDDADVANENEVLYTESTDENVLSDEQLLEILVDDDEEMTVTSGTPLKLENGYELAIRSIDIDGNKVYLELTKDGAVVDSKVISPSKDNANMADKTYYYKKDVGDSKSVVIIAVHFKNAFRGADQDLATVDGEWQLSDTATEVKDDTEYDKMTITSSTPTTITMENKDNAVTLSKNKDITLMPGVGIKTADNDTLRYYIYTEQTIEGAAAEENVTAPVEAAPAENVTAPVEEAAPAENVTAPAEEAAPAENETAPAEEAAPAENETAENATAPAESQGMPGFEGAFALSGLVAVAYLVLGRKQ